MTDSARSDHLPARGAPALATGHAELPDEEATAALALAIAPALTPGMIIFLRGELGAGKTSFARSLLQALGYQDRVKSPTFTLVELYNLSRYELYHFDFYRFTHENEWLNAGFDELIGSAGAVSLIEWPERGGEELPAPDLTVHLRYRDDGASGRDALIAAFSPQGVACLNAACAAGCCSLD